MSMLIVRSYYIYLLGKPDTLQQPLYPTLLILLIARHKTPLTETLTSIDVTTAEPISPSDSVVDIVELQAVPDPIEKVGDELYDPYVDITASSPGASSQRSFRLEPNRRS